MLRRNLSALLAVVTIGAATPAATHAASKPGPHKAVARVKQLIARRSNQVEIVTFTDPRLTPVKVVRGQSAAAHRPEQVEMVTFADPKLRAVRILRGGADAEPPPRAADKNIETVSFADPGLSSVTVFRGMALRGMTLRGMTLRGPAPRGLDIELFRPASTADLDRVAFAVDGAESSHGSDPGMWRSDWAGPQGPMQVSAAAASDLGGGDRFDLLQNRLLGRAYLARMFRRYGNWPDAIVAYNWGPGNLDAWIGAGRPAERLPLGVERYRARVLHEVGLRTAPMPAQRSPPTQP